MAVYLSPGVYTREIDLSLIPSSQGALVPAFIGAANKGPMNAPTLITTSGQYIDTFGEPFADSYLGYAVLAYMEEGISCWVLRVGVEYTPGLDDSLIPDSIDTSGTQHQGWGRIPIFANIDYGYILLREVSEANPVVIHDDSVGSVSASNIDASMVVTEGSAGYIGAFDETFSVLITTTSTATDGITGAGYQIATTSGGVIATGTIPSNHIVTDLQDGYDLTLTFHQSTSAGIYTAGDIFTFTAQPDNTSVSVSVEGETAVTFSIAPAGTTTGYTTAQDLADALNAGLATASSEFSAVVMENSADVNVVAIRTTVAGHWIQLVGGEAFCAEVGVAAFSYDIPRSYLLCTQDGPYNLTSANNRVVLDVIGLGSTKRLDFTINSGLGTTVDNLVTLLQPQGTSGGNNYFEALSITIPGGAKLPIILTTVNNLYDQLKMQVSFVFQATMRFAAQVGISFPYTKAFRSFWDARPVLPTIGVDGVSPDACDNHSTNYSVSQCSLDTAYYANVVGWIVAKTPGTWANNYSIGLEVFTQGVGDAAGRFTVSVYDADGVVVDSTQDVSFDPSDTRYIANVVNAGSAIGGVNGNTFYSWVLRPDFLVDTSSIRVPSTFLRHFTGGANGIPSDPLQSEALDNAVIGNPALSSGLYALSNPESFDFNLLLIPGFTSGAVIGQAIQFAENRGDVLYIVDPPFGLRPQEVVEWHNGMLLSDLANAINSSYGALYWGWLLINDQFNGGTIWIPPSGHAASVFARTAEVAEQWFAPAGINRGRLLSPINVEYNPTQGERDVLYGSGNAVNPIVKLGQEGITIFGQRTLQRASTALDRINVRMLLIFLKKNLSVTLRSFLFEPNDTITRKQVLAVVNPFLADVAARRGLTAFNVVCDETNNTPERIDRNELWVSVFIQPTRAIEFIALNIAILATGASFSAQEVLAAGGVVTTQ